MSSNDASKELNAPCEPSNVALWSGLTSPYRPSSVAYATVLAFFPRAPRDAVYTSAAASTASEHSTGTMIWSCLSFWLCADPALPASGAAVLPAGGSVANVGGEILPPSVPNST